MLKSREMSPVLKRDLAKLGEGFANEDEIAMYIEKLGLKRYIPRYSKTSDWMFQDPETKYKFVSYTTGEVRSISPTTKGYFGGFTKSVSRMTRNLIPTTRDRLLMILRRTMKAKGIYTLWKSGRRTAKELIDSNLMKAVQLGLI
jgi:hypothetical protein